eukprot:CAMPEP_0184308372 /NCGR_PEP_ID=MMETSP1049-20130417/16845_1 /TAXON_ID=77928 /ORGANISM="Proteomonas sulcata, Strain CCMP704" /LENGTH=410 /DNA_ID=CAMNT_0026621047 /DNA_START=51 /DNA_END=1283 /DNA_ORIENTATION=+
MAQITAELSRIDLLKVMDIYLERTREIIEKLGGTFDEFDGDYVTAFWKQDPYEPGEDAVKACQAAERLVEAVDNMNFAWYLHGISIRVQLKCTYGIQTGTVLVGNYGSATRLKYGAFGRNVDIAQRLAHVAKTCNKQVVLHADARDQVVGCYRCQYAVTSDFGIVYELVNVANSFKPDVPRSPLKQKRSKSLFKNISEKMRRVSAAAFEGSRKKSALHSLDVFSRMASAGEHSAGSRKASTESIGWREGRKMSRESFNGRTSRKVSREDTELVLQGSATLKKEGSFVRRRSSFTRATNAARMEHTSPEGRSAGSPLWSEKDSKPARRRTPSPERRSSVWIVKSGNSKENLGTSVSSGSKELLAPPAGSRESSPSSTKSSSPRASGRLPVVASVSPFSAIKKAEFYQNKLA